MQLWNRVPDDSVIAATAAALRTHGLQAHIVNDAAAAQAKALELLPANAEVMTMTSVTLEHIGLAQAINDGTTYRSVRRQLEQLDTATEGNEKRRLSAAPDWVVGSVHAVTQDGRVLVASNSGSQLPAYAFGAANVLWVIGAQKIVPTLEAGLRRIEEHSLALESERAKIAYGVPGSAVNKLFILNQEIRPGRITIILVKQVLGF